MGDDEDDEDESSDEENEDPRAKSGKGKPSLGKRKTMASRFQAPPKNRRKPKRASPSSLHTVSSYLSLSCTTCSLSLYLFIICSGCTNRNRVRERDGAGKESGRHKLVVHMYRAHPAISVRLSPLGCIVCTFKSPCLTQSLRAPVC